MNIAYDIFIEHPEAIDIVSKMPDLDTFFTELINFIATRLSVLVDEIESEENENEMRGIIICIMREDNRFINFYGYTDSLKSRMLGCFSKGDIDFILNKISQIKQSRNN
jgi:hypothetical protein